MVQDKFFLNIRQLFHFLPEKNKSEIINILIANFINLSKIHFVHVLVLKIFVFRSKMSVKKSKNQPQKKRLFLG